VPEPFRTAARFVEKTWGSGVRMRTHLGLDAPVGTGEAWLVSDVEGAPSEVLDGPWKGRTLRDVVRDQPEALLGGDAARWTPPGADGPRFPLLVKLLEVSSPLSVQVHPDAATAAALGDPPHGKCEAWLVLEPGPEATVWLGLEEPIAPGELARLSEAGGLADRLHAFAPEAGEGVEVLPGTFHTAKDLLMLEVQETSDITYRVWDWGRPRELHLEQAAACLARLPRGVPERQAPFRGGVRELAPGSPFAFWVRDLPASGRVELAEAGPCVVVVLEGDVRLDHLALRRGEAAVVPAAAGPVWLAAERPARVASAAPREAP